MANPVLDEVTAHEARLGLPSGFYRELFQEDDWSFVIKLNALVEASATHALVSCLQAPQLEDHFSSLDLGNTKHGKIVLLKALGSLTSEQVAVLQLLYQLRNKLAHNIRQVTFQFTDYLAGLDKQQRANFLKCAGHGIKEVIPLSGTSVSRNRFAADNPKLALWLTVAEIIACLNLDSPVKPRPRRWVMKQV